LKATTTFEDFCLKFGVKAGEKVTSGLSLNTKTPAESQIGDDIGSLQEDSAQHRHWNGGLQDGIYSRG
jgi:hypothetical protein